jgi:colanic acid/amylovoran biosynthesis glycosyltransferase
MSATLAVFTSQIGTPSETFIRRHIEDLLPGRTVAIARHSRPGEADFWQPSCPVLYLDRWAARWPGRLARRAGITETALRERGVARFLRKHGVTVVLGEYLDQFIDFVPLLGRMHLPYVVQGHGIDLSASLRNAAMRSRYLAYTSARAVLTRSEFHRRRLIDIGLPASRIAVNPGGVDVPADVPPPAVGRNQRFLAIGRMVPKKGPLHLLEAFHLAATTDRDITLDVLGDGPLLPAASEFVGASGLHAHVRLHGAAPDETKRRLLLECGTFVQHSMTDPQSGDEEGLPAAIQEAMAHGLAVISTRHAGIPESVEDDVTGLLVGEGDSAGMARAMLRLSSQPDLCLRLGAAGRTKAAQSYTWAAERARLLKSLALDE